MGPSVLPARYCIVKVAPVGCEELGSYRRPPVAEHEVDEHDLDAIHWETRFRKTKSTEEDVSYKIRRACIDLQGEVLLGRSHLHWDSVRSANQCVE